MNTRSNASRRLDEDITNAGDLLSGDQVPSLEEDVNDDQAQLDPSLKAAAIRAAPLQTSQAITTQAQDASNKDQGMMD